MSKRIILLSIGGILAIAAFMLLTRTAVWKAITKSKRDFIEYSTVNNLFYEQGAETFAEDIARCLDPATSLVEKNHYLHFADPFKIFVCSTRDSFDEFLANKSHISIRGAALRGNVFISPVAFDFMGMDTHCETLKHELSHLLIQQRLGIWKRKRIPNWFHEGFADYLAGSGGEGTRPAEAAALILSGTHFIPVEKGTLFGSLRKSLNGLSGPLFHQQTKMFVTFLAESNKLDFKQFLIRVQEGDAFSESFAYAMGTDVQSKWDQFTSYLKTKFEIE